MWRKLLVNALLKKSHILILIAILIGVVAFVSRPSYAGGAFSEIPYAARSDMFSSGQPEVTVKWSKACSRLKDGTITDVSGYEIQYAPNANYSNSRRLYLASDSNKEIIKLKELDTEEKYKEGIGKYNFRIRSYVRVSGKKVYSKWTEITKVKTVEVYSPVALYSIKADRNSMKAEWKKVSGADGYIVFGRKAGEKKWQKKRMIRDPEELKYKEDGLDYACEYIYSVIAYRKQAANDPSVLNTSYLKLLSDGENSYKILTTEFTVEEPELRAIFYKDVLHITWSASDGADSYRVEVSKTEDFQDPRVFEFNKDMILDDMTSYTQELDDVEQTDYYVRVRAGASHKNKEYYSDYSDVKHAEYGAGIYTIKYVSNGGDGEMEPSMVGVREEFKLPGNEFTRDGYVFTGWALKQDNETVLDLDQPIQQGIPDYSDKDRIKDLAGSGKTVKLYACWEGAGPEAAADWAELIANDDEFYYGKGVKNHCWFCQGGDKIYICNAFVAAAYTHGMPYFNSYRSGSTDYSWWLKNGFSDVGENVPATEIRKGDIICCWNGRRWGHIMIAVSDGDGEDPRVAHAARKGTDPKSVRVDPLGDRLAKYKKYHVVRYKQAD